MRYRERLVVCILFLCASFLVPESVSAALLRLSPDTGVFVQGTTFTTSIILNTEGKPVNAADAELSFNPRELSVVGLTKGTLFSLWTLEPTFSNTAGTVSFGGGSPSGYTGKNGSIITITWRALVSGTPKVSWKSGSVLAADGLGTNVLTGMNGASYTIDAKTSVPAPEYIPAPNTPASPRVRSDTHPEEAKWYRETTAHLVWDVPSGVIAVRTAFDREAESIPNVTYDEPILEKTISDIAEGVSYFHIQFKNSDGWGRIAHYAIRVDTTEPSVFVITETTPNAVDAVRTFRFDVEDTSPIVRYLVIRDGLPAEEWIKTSDNAEYVTPPLSPGEHTLVVTAYDSAGLSRTETKTFTVDALTPPRLTEYSDRFPTSAITLFKGETLPQHEIVATIRALTSGKEYEIRTKARDDGTFTLVPEFRFDVGSYEITLRAIAENGAQSDESDAVRFVVYEPGYVVVGTVAIRILSLLVPIISLILMLVFGTWFLWHRLSVWQKNVLGETKDAEQKLQKEFTSLVLQVRETLGTIKSERKGKITARESLLFSQIEDNLHQTEKRLKKELTDIETIVE